MVRYTISRKMLNKNDYGSYDKENVSDADADEVTQSDGLLYLSKLMAKLLIEKHQKNSPTYDSHK